MNSLHHSASRIRLLGVLLLVSVLLLRTESLDGFDSAAESAIRGRRNLQNSSSSSDEYIVVFKDQPDAGTDSSASIESIKAGVESLGGTVLQSYVYALTGFAAVLPPAAVTVLEASPYVSYIEPNAIFYTTTTVATTTTTTTTQTQDLSWGLDRIDQVKGTDGNYTYNQTGSGVHAYVIDTGISSTHEEFTGRLGEGYNAVTDSFGSPQPWDDCNQHGTHVASTIGGTKYGVAKQVTLHAVRVLNCQGSGSLDDILAGMDWVIYKHIRSKEKIKKSVANMSLAGQYSRSLNDGVAKMVAAGIVVGVAAGNDGYNACGYSPASTANILAVGATTSSDARASFSNYGPCVKIFAPGSGILGADYKCSTCSKTLSGTSMASPHVVGVAALYWQNNTGSAAQIRSAILNTAVNGTVTSANTYPNLFLQSRPIPLVEGWPNNTDRCRPYEMSCRKLFCKRLRSSRCCCSGLQCKGTLVRRCA